MHICIIEDHPIIQLSLKILVRNVYPKAEFILAGSFPDGIAALKRQQFELMILDIDVPDSENIRMMSIVKEIQSDIKILIYSAFDEMVYALPYIQGGADGYISKNAKSEDFYLALATVMNNQKYISKAVQYTLINGINGDIKRAQNPLNTLSPKEVTVMQYLIEGKWTKEIAIILNLKENTVSTFKRRIFDKLEVSDAIELAKKVSLLKNI